VKGELAEEVEKVTDEAEEEKFEVE